MEVSRVTFTDEFLEKTKHKNLSPQAKGKLRWERLVRADGDGTLQRAKTRMDIAKIAGIQEGRNAYAWVTTMIYRGVLKETLVGFENNKAIYEYHIGKPLNYTNGRKTLSDRIKREKAEKQVAEQQRPQQIVAERQKPINNSSANVSIIINGTEIKVENANAKFVVELIREIKK